MKTTRILDQNKNYGFTIMELMIATAVFSILLLLALAGFLQIGRLFYKGVNITRTSDVAKQVVASTREDISFDTSTATISPQSAGAITTPTGSVTRYWFCAGQNRYSYILGRQLNTANEATEMKSFPVAGWYRFALLKDKLTVSGCPNPYTSSVPINPANVTELLGDKMRLSNLTIQPVLGSLYTLRVHIAYGDDEVLTSPPSATNAKCRSGANFSSYCFVTDLRTTVRRGFAP